MDDEMEKRVAIHRSRRPAGWRTVDAPHGSAAHLREALQEQPAGCVLLDCLSVLTSNVLLTLDENVPEADAFPEALELQCFLRLPDGIFGLENLVDALH